MSTAAVDARNEMRMVVFLLRILMHQAVVTTDAVRAERELDSDNATGKAVPISAFHSELVARPPRLSEQKPSLG
jgi:hypothetical protein